VLDSPTYNYIDIDAALAAEAGTPVPPAEQDCGKVDRRHYNPVLVSIFMSLFSFSFWHAKRSHTFFNCSCR
jgi:hypothetical protein